jgi:hypothetical protein
MPKDTWRVSTGPQAFGPVGRFAPAVHPPPSRPRMLFSRSRNLHTSLTVPDLDTKWLTRSSYFSSLPQGYLLSFFGDIDWFDHISWAFGLIIKPFDNHTQSWNASRKKKNRFEYQVMWHNHLIISDSVMLCENVTSLQNVHSQIKQTRLNLRSRTQSIWQPPPPHPFSCQLPVHRRVLPFPVNTIITEVCEESFDITSRQFGIDSCLQYAFQRLVYGPL